MNYMWDEQEKGALLGSQILQYKVLKVPLLLYSYLHYILNHTTYSVEPALVSVLPASAVDKDDDDMDGTLCKIPTSHSTL